MYINIGKEFYMQKNAVIGVSINFDENQLKNLILSFREVNIVDDLILFVDPLQRPVLEYHFSKYNVIFKSFCFYNVASTIVHNSRYFKCLEFLSDHTEYKNIFLTDTKDVIFQSDPFEDLDGEFLYFFQEDAGVSILDDPGHNAWWLASAYGPEVLDQIGNYNIICSGTILGSYKRILKLLETVRREFLKIKVERPDTFSNTILDQAVINYLSRLDTDTVTDSTVKANGDIVATLGIPTSNQFSHTDQVMINGYSIMVNSHLPRILHQYDRNEILRNLYHERYKL
jgi:hypothetical protein